MAAFDGAAVEEVSRLEAAGQEAKPSDGTAHLLGTKTAGCAIWEGHLEIGWEHSFGGAANSPGMVWRGLGERLNQGDGL